MARRMARATTVGAAHVKADLVVKARATADRAPMALRVVVLEDREIVVPMGVARAVSGADPMVLLAGRGLADLAGRDGAARMVLVADLKVVVRMTEGRAVSDGPMVLLADRTADLVVLAVAVAQAVVNVLVSRAGLAAEGESSNEWIKSTASLTKSCGRLSP